MRMRPRLLTLAIVVLAWNSVAFAQDRSVELPTKDQRSPAAKFKISIAPEEAKPGETVTPKIDANLQGKWHIYPLKLPKDVDGLAAHTTLSSAKSCSAPSTK